MKKRVIVILSAFIIIVLVYVFNLLSFNRNGNLLLENAGENDRIVQSDDHLSLAVSEQGDNTTKIRIIQKCSPRLFEKEYELTANPKDGYFDVYTQTHYIYIAGRLIETGKSTAPAGAGDGYLSWFSGFSGFDISRFMPSIVMIETEFISDEPIGPGKLELETGARL